jgi:hypothetical protein
MGYSVRKRAAARIRGLGGDPRSAGPQTASSERTRPIDAWIEDRTGKPASRVTIADILAVPRRRGLKWGPVRSSLGGRLDSHLKHLDDEEAAELMERGDRFLNDTPDEPVSSEPRSARPLARK